MKLPRVWVVVLNWNNAPDTLRCLASLERQDYPDLRILVVDNGSTDGSLERIREACSGLEALALTENLGFGGGMNRGMDYSLAAGAEYVLLLNNDAELAPDAVRLLVAAMEAHPGAGLAAPTIFHHSPPGAPWYAGGRLSRWTGTAEHWTHDPTPEIRSVTFATGCCWLVRPALVARVGGLNERYFLYVEDVEYCDRVLAAEFEILHVGASHAWHEVGASTQSQQAKAPALDYYDTRNGLWFIRERLRGAQRLTACAYYWGVRMPRKLARIILAARDRRSSLTAVLRGLRDGLRVT